MALQMQYTKEVYGKELVFEAAYIQVTSTFTTKTTAESRVIVYADSSKQQIIDQKGYPFTPDMTNDSDNSIKQGYVYLKTLPQYAGAVDC